MFAEGVAARQLGCAQANTRSLSVPALGTVCHLLEAERGNRAALAHAATRVNATSALHSLLFPDVARGGPDRAITGRGAAEFEPRAFQRAGTSNARSLLSLAAWDIRIGSIVRGDYSSYSITRAGLISSVNRGSTGLSALLCDRGRQVESLAFSVIRGFHS